MELVDVVRLEAGLAAVLAQTLHVVLSRGPQLLSLMKKNNNYSKPIFLKEAEIKKAGLSWEVIE